MAAQAQRVALLHPTLDRNEHEHGRFYEGRRRAHRLVLEVIEFLFVFLQKINIFFPAESRWDHLDRCKLTNDSSAVALDPSSLRLCQSGWLSSTKTLQLALLTQTSSLVRCSRSSDSNTSTTHIGSPFRRRSPTSDGSTKSGSLVFSVCFSFNEPF